MKAERPLGGRSSYFHSQGNKKDGWNRAARKQEVAAVFGGEAEGHASLYHLTPTPTVGSVGRGEEAESDSCRSPTGSDVSGWNERRGEGCKQKNKSQEEIKKRRNAE